MTKPWVIEKYHDLMERSLVIESNRSQHPVYISVYEAALTQGYDAARRQVKEVMQMYREQRLACGCVDCLSELGLAARSATEAR